MRPTKNQINELCDLNLFFAGAPRIAISNTFRNIVGRTDFGTIKEDCQKLHKVRLQHKHSAVNCMVKLIL